MWPAAELRTANNINTGTPTVQPCLKPWALRRLQSNYQSEVGAGGFLRS